VGYGSRGIAITPDGTQVYVTGSNSGTYVINTATNQVKVVIPITVASTGTRFTELRAVTVSPDGKRAYVTSYGFGSPGNTVSVIDTSNNLVLVNIPVVSSGSALYGIAVSLDGARVYAVKENTNSVFVIDAATNEVAVDTIPVGSSPRAITTASIPC
jgi:YVTN family beta-propeller protein